MFSYVPDFLPSSIVLIGAGGTGSRLMPMLAQLVRTCLRQYNPNAWLERLPIFVIDGDAVEEKNLLRQNFIHKDIGKNKATVLATRYSTAFGIPIYPSPQFLKVNESLNFLGYDTRFSFQNSVVIMAVDSAEARRTILKSLNMGPQRIYDGSTKNCFVIDAGNEDAFGQVKFFNMKPLWSRSDFQIAEYASKFPNQIPKEYKVDFIPVDFKYYQELGSSTQELSCAELPQTLAINAMMATMICAVLQNFLYLKPMNFDGIRFNMNGSMSTEYNTPRRWVRRTVSHDYNFEENKCFGIGSREMMSTGVLMPSPLFETMLKETTTFFKSSGLIVDSSGELIPDPSYVPPKPPELKKEIPKDEKSISVEDVKTEVSATGTPELESQPLPPPPALEPLPLTPVPLVVPRRARAPRRTGVTLAEVGVVPMPTPTLTFPEPVTPPTATF